MTRSVSLLYLQTPLPINYPINYSIPMCWPCVLQIASNKPLLPPWCSRALKQNIQPQSHVEILRFFHQVITNVSVQTVGTKCTVAWSRQVNSTTCGGRYAQPCLCRHRHYIWPPTTLPVTLQQDSGQQLNDTPLRSRTACSSRVTTLYVLLFVFSVSWILTQLNPVHMCSSEYCRTAH